MRLAAGDGKDISRAFMKVPWRLEIAKKPVVSIHGAYQQDSCR
jgi:hypothetical protein